MKTQTAWRANPGKSRRRFRIAIGRAKKMELTESLARSSSISLLRSCDVDHIADGPRLLRPYRE